MVGATILPKYFSAAANSGQNLFGTKNEGRGARGRKQEKQRENSFVRQPQRDPLQVLAKKMGFG